MGRFVPLEVVFSPEQGGSVNDGGVFPAIVRAIHGRAPPAARNALAIRGHLWQVGSDLLAVD